MEEGVQNGMVLAITEDEVVIRHLDALYVCKPGDNNPNETVVTTTLNHFMKQNALKNVRKFRTYR